MEQSGCDLTAQVGDYLAQTYERPRFYLDSTYHDTLKRQYFVHELQEMIRFLEILTHRKLDPVRCTRHGKSRKPG
jgi:hypothetical protein